MATEHQTCPDPSDVTLTPDRVCEQHWIAESVGEGFSADAPLVSACRTPEGREHHVSWAFGMVWLERNFCLLIILDIT